MSKSHEDDLVEEAAKEPADEVFRLYLRLAKSDPDKAEVAALALRNKARRGEVDEKAIPLLQELAGAARDQGCLVHLAKALAAFGRKAQPAAATIADRIRNLPVTDDAEYWVLDSCVWALAWLGGEEARVLVGDLANESPSRAVKQDKVYRGDLTRTQREKRFASTLDGARALIDQKDPGRWDKKMTALGRKQAGKSGPRKLWDR